MVSACLHQKHFHHIVKIEKLSISCLLILNDDWLFLAIPIINPLSDWPISIKKNDDDRESNVMMVVNQQGHKINDNIQISWIWLLKLLQFKTVTRLTAQNHHLSFGPNNQTRWHRSVHLDAFLRDLNLQISKFLLFGVILSQLHSPLI